VAIRPMKRSDSHALSRALGDRSVTKYLPYRVQHETGLQFVTRALREQRFGAGFSFAIVVGPRGEVVGQVRLMNWSPEEERAELGIWLARTHWGRGYGTDAARLACQFGFHSMRLHRILAQVVAGNDASAAMLRRLGFRREGSLRKEARIGKTWTDVWVFGLLRRELKTEARSR
jgi:[ribosomal protein S5]-alanine N-acetyltransferase